VAFPLLAAIWKRDSTLFLFFLSLISIIFLLCSSSYYFNSLFLTTLLSFSCCSLNFLNRSFCCTLVSKICSTGVTSYPAVFR
jgi:hypothetical protein